MSSVRDMLVYSATEWCGGEPGTGPGRNERLSFPGELPGPSLMEGKTGGHGSIVSVQMGGNIELEVSIDSREAIL